jgi:hypothetical protein
MSASYKIVVVFDRKKKYFLESLVLTAILRRIQIHSAQHKPTHADGEVQYITLRISHTLCK